MGDARDRPIVVTGAASGMGRATAVLMAARGHPVVLIDINERGLEATQAEIRRAGGAALMAVADVRSRVLLESAFAAGELEFGGCWGLAAAAGVIEGALVADVTDEHFDRLVKINLFGLAVCNQLAAAQMRRLGRGGRIVNWASDAGIGASPGFSIYAATKAAVLSLTTTAAIELAEFGITVNAIVPGIVDTPIADYLTADQKIRLARLIPVGRWGRAEEIAAFAGFLFSDESAYMTGSTMVVDGGATSALGRHLLERMMAE